MTESANTQKIDAIDQKILSFLVKNARMPFLEISRECGISGAAIHQRVRKMEQMGIITGSRLQVKPQALGLNVCAYLGITLAKADEYHGVIEALRRLPEVVECQFITGKHSLLIKIYCFDNNHLLNVIVDTIQNIPGIASTETLVCLREEFERQVWVNTEDYDTEGEKAKTKGKPRRKPRSK